MNDEPQHKHRKYYILALFAVFIAILGVILPETEFTPKQYINASNITVTGAANVSGSLINLSDINQGYYNVSEGNAQPFSVTVNFTNITNFSFLEVKSKYFSASGTPSSHIVDLEILCYTDMEYEDLFFLENAAEWRYFTRHFPDSTHFIDAQGNVSIKFNHTANGNVNHRLWIDTVRLVIKETFEQNTVTLNQYFNTTTTGGGGVSFDGNPVDMNGSNQFNGTISNYSTLNYTNSSLSGKVNKSGDNMTWNLKVLNVEIGSINNSAGFEMNDTSFYGSFDAYNDSNGGYLSLNANAYYDPIGQKWYKKNASQYAAISALAYYKDVSISNPFWGVIFSAPTANPFSNQVIPILVYPDAVNIYKNTTISTLAGTGNNAITRLDSTGKLIRDNIDGYTSGDVFLCFNATVGAYAC